MKWRLGLLHISACTEGDSSTLHLCRAIIAMLAVVLVWPYATNGLWFDDAINSQIRSMVERFETTVWHLSMAVSKVWIEQAGRLLLCWPVLYSYFYVTHDPAVIRISDLSLLAVHVLLACSLLKRLGANGNQRAWFVLLLISFFQIRTGDDPIGAYASFSQLNGIALTWAFLLLHGWYQGRAMAMLVASVLVAALSLLMYEINLIYFPIAAIVIWRSRYPARLRSLAVLAIPLAAFLLASALVKHHAPSPYAGAALGNAKEIPVTYLKQWVATLPGSFYLFAGHRSVQGTRLFADALRDPGCLLAGALGAAAWALLCLTTGRAKVSRLSPIGSIGAFQGAIGIMLLAPVLIAASARYQAGLRWGEAHLPVYYQYFGLAAAGAILIDRLASRAPRRLQWLAPLFGLYVASNLWMNQHQAAWLDQIFDEPRQSFERAVRNGLLERVRNEDAVVMATNVPPFINGNLIYQLTGRRVAIPDEAATALYFKARIRRDARCYLIERETGPPFAWRVGEACPRDPLAAANILTN